MAAGCFRPRICPDCRSRAARLGIGPQRGDLSDRDRESRGRPDRHRQHRHRALALGRRRAMRHGSPASSTVGEPAPSATVSPAIRQHRPAFIPVVRRAPRGACPRHPPASAPRSACRPAATSLREGGAVRCVHPARCANRREPVRRHLRSRAGCLGAPAAPADRAQRPHVGRIDRRPSRSAYGPFPARWPPGRVRACWLGAR